MLVNCKACKKKFTVSDAAITESGRLLQCGSCGNKWIQYPIEKKLVEEIKKTTLINLKQSASVNKIKTSLKKKKRKINLYSEEYLKKKHGLSIKDDSDLQKKRAKKKKISYNIFYRYLITIFVFTIALFGVLNLSKDIIVANYPFVGPYIDHLYEILSILKITISEFFNFF
jgi:predicted Zn finger-like uncharacterized protein